MSTSLVVYVVALVFLIVGFVMAVVTNQIQAPLFWVAASIAVVVVFSGFPGIAR